MYLICSQVSIGDVKPGSIIVDITISLALESVAPLAHAFADNTVFPMAFGNVSVVSEIPFTGKPGSFDAAVSTLGVQRCSMLYQYLQGPS